MSRFGSGSRSWFAVSLLLFVAALAVSISIFDEQYLLLSFLLVIVAMIPFFVRFEKKSIGARELVLLAVLAAIAAVSRVPFAPLPSIQPTTFVVIMSALAFGAEAGFMIGAIAALVSNMLLGQGPWTPWQMFCWGLVGASAGWLRHTLFLQKRWGLLSFGIAWGFLFGWTMNIWALAALPDAISWQLIAIGIADSFLFDLAHALSNAFFLAVFGSGWLTVLLRFKRKYGLLDGAG